MVTDALTREREDLEELVGSVGWQRFKTRCLEEAKGLGYIARMRSAMNGTMEDVKVVHRSMLEVEKMLQWPEDRIESIERGE